MSQAEQKSPPAVADLYSAYRNFVTADTLQRVNALWDAIAWWDLRLGWKIDRSTLDAEEAKAYARAAKMRAHALGAGTTEEKETALIQAVRQYDKTNGNVSTEDDDTDEKRKGKITGLHYFISKLKNERASLEAKIATKNAPYADMLQAMNTYYSPLGVVFKIGEHSEDVKIHDSSNLTVSRLYADGMRALYDAKAFASLVLNQVHRVLMLRCLDNGTPDLVRMWKDIPHTLTFIGTALDGAGLRGYREAAEGEAVADAPEVPAASAAPIAQPAPAPVPPPAPPPPPFSFSQKGRRPRFKAPFTQGTAPTATGTKTSPADDYDSRRVGGYYRPNTAMATLYYFMIANNGKTVDTSDLIALIPEVSSPGGRIHALAKKGRETGRWTIISRSDKTSFQVHNP